MKTIPVRKIAASPKERESLGSFTLRGVDDLLNGKDLTHALHRHDFFFVLAIDKGNGSHQIDFTDFEVKDNGIFFLRPGQVHQLELKSGSSGYIMEFNNDFFSPSRKISNKNFCQVDKDRFKILLGILKYMMQENTDKQDGFITILKANLEIFFTELVRQSANSGISKIASYTQERLDEFLLLLETNYAQHKQVAYYTNKMSLSPYQLNEITKASLDKTATDLINDHIMLEAKRYLLATSAQVKEIADQLGYEDSSYFIRFFKKHSGHSPESFRAISR